MKGDESEWKAFGARRGLESVSANDVVGYLQGLARKRPVFHSEADFQHALAWHIHEAMPDSDVRLEFKPFPCEKLYLDICLPDVGVAIELKYKTRKAELPHDNEVFSLRDQAAQDCGRYDFIQDVGRLERVVVDSAAPAKVGIAVFLTNDPLYWECPRFLKSRGKMPNDCNFRIHEGRKLCGELVWHPPYAGWKPNNREEPISLTGVYDLTWSDYTSFGDGRSDFFRYLCVSVLPQHQR